MSKVSIYENGWIDVVFAGRNQEYGAYQLRQQSPRTTMMALFLGLLFLTTAVSIPMLVNYFNSSNPVTINCPLDEPIVLVDLTPVQPQTPDQMVLPAVKNPEEETATDETQLKDPVVVETNQAQQNIADNGEKTKPDSPTTPAGDGNGTTPTTTPGTVVTAPNPVDPNAVVSTVALDKLPEFPGGLNKFYMYVGNNFEKPETEIERTMKVIVSFVIERDGSMTDIQVKRDPGYGLGKEAIRVLKSLKTKWSPGMIDGKPVRTSYNLPITVKME